jgi:hypothetical protein
MGASAGKIFKVIGIAAIGFATWGVGSLIIGGATVASAIGGGIAFGSFAVSFSTLASIGVLGLSIGSVPKFTQGQTGANQRGTATADPNAVGIFAFGETTVPCQLVFEQLHSSEDQITNVFSHAWHEIESYQTLHVDGELVNFSGVNATGDYAGILTWRTKLGSPGQTALSIQTNTDWETTATFAGAAHSSMSWDFKNQDKLTGGVPIRMDLVVEGAHLYDPREDNDYGSGSHDFDDSTTWTYEAGNAALVLLRFLIGEYTPGGVLIWGRGALESEIIMDTFVAMADIADETVGGKPRFRIQGIHYLDGSFENFCKQWEHETGGKVYKTGGQYGCWLPHDDLTAVTTITEAHFLAGAQIGHTIASDIHSLYNTARGRYIEPDQGYKGFPYPEVTEDNEIVDDGGKRVMPLEFSWIQDPDIAQRIAHIKIRRSRFQRLWSIPMGWQGQGPNYAHFTVHTLNCNETGNQDQICRVIDRRRAYNGVTQLIVQQEDVSLYDDTIPLNDPLASNEIPLRLDRIGSLTPRYIDGTFLDWGPYSVGYVLDPNFQRGTRTVEFGGAEDPLRVFWQEASLGSYPQAVISSTGGITGGFVTLGPNTVTPTQSAALISIGRPTTRFLSGESVRLTGRVRKRFSTTLASGFEGGLSFKMAGTSPDNFDFLFGGAPEFELGFEYTDINGWTVDDWQEFNSVVLAPTISGDRAYGCGYIAWIVDPDVTPIAAFELEFFNIVPVATP